MLTVRFHEKADDGRLRFAVIVARHRGQWVFCQHRRRDTWEIPGGHREAGEKIDETARRELWEETGAADFSLRRVCAYSVRDGGEETFGMLYAAEIFSFGPLPETEIGRAALFSELPEAWTYPLIQPRLFDRVCLEPARGAGEKA